MTDQKQLYLSPLTAINEEVRRKHGAIHSHKTHQTAAAAADPWDEQEISGGVHPQHSRSYLPQDSVCLCTGTNRTSSSKSPLRRGSSGFIAVDRIDDFGKEAVVGVATEECFRCGKPTTFHSRTLQTFKVKSTLKDPDHAEALLETTPQLRFMTPLSKDNLLLMYISHAVDRTTDGQTIPNIANDTDYEYSLERDRINDKAAAELASLLWLLAHEMSFEDYGALESSVFTSVFRLIHANNKLDKMAGLAAVAALLPVPSADTERKIIKLANSLSHGLRAVNGDFETMRLCAQNLGTLAAQTASVDFVEAEITRALEWLQMERSDRRYVKCTDRRN